MKQWAADLLAFGGGIIAAKLAVSLASLVRPGQGAPKSPLQAMKDQALGAAAIVGAPSPVISYAGSRSEAAGLFAAGLGAMSALEMHRWERWGA